MAMPDISTIHIYLVNETSDPQVFWCFLAPPQELAGDPGVYANSSAGLGVGPKSPLLNVFTIPVQYQVGASGRNDPVGPGVVIVSDLISDAAMQDTWEVGYLNWPPKLQPFMTTYGVKSPPNTIAIHSSPFDKANNEANGWFSNQSFGIKYNSGFMGMTWSPDPNQTRTLTPQLTFYVTAAYNLNSNALAPWSEISNSAAKIDASFFSSHNKCTVTYTGDREWVIT
jgi:hypothetical protein